MLHKEYDPTYEQNLLGAMLIDNRIYDEAEMSVEDFQQPVNRKLYEVVQGIIERGEQANVVSLAAKMPEQVSYISKLTSMSLSAANWKYYADRIKAAALWNQVSKLKLHFEDWIRDKSSDEVLAEVDKYICDLNEKNKGRMKKASELLGGVIDEIQNRYKNKGVMGLSTGFPELDEIIGGLRNSETIVIAARPGMGKTTIALNIALHLLSLLVPVGIFSIEMSADLLLYRMLSAKSNIESKKFRTGKFMNQDFHNIIQASGEIYNMDLYIDDSPNMSISTLRNRARMMKRRGVKIIFIDYLTLIKHGDMKLPRWERVGDISKQLKQLARETDIPIVVLSQLGRTAEGSRPSLAELRQSGEIEEDSDCIVFLYGKRDSNFVKIEVAKNRNWSTGECELYFEKEKARFTPVLNRDGGRNEE